MALPNDRIAYFWLLVEEGLRRLGLKPEEARTGNVGQWVVKRGSAEVAMVVAKGTNKEGVYLILASPVLELANRGNHDELMRHLLHLNHELFGASFSIHNNMVFLTATHDMLTISPDGVARALDALSYFADKLDGEMQEKYKMAERPAMGFGRVFQTPLTPPADTSHAPPITSEDCMWEKAERPHRHGE